MSEKNEELVRRLWNQIWLESELDPLGEILADPYIRHTRDGTYSTSPADYATHISSMVRLIRGTSVEFDHIASTDDMVYARLTLEGVNLDAGTPVTLTWLTQYRIADRRIAEAWTMHQTGIDW